MAPKTIFIAVILICHYFSLSAGGSPHHSASINGINICDEIGVPTIALPAWVGKVYVPMPDTYRFYANLTIYIHSGDTCKVEYGRNINIVQAGEYRLDYDGGCGEDYTNILIVQYLPDSLQDYYTTHFDQNYLDSVRNAADSLASIKSFQQNPPPQIFPNPVSDKIYLNEFFVEQTTVDVSLYNLENGTPALQKSMEVHSGIQLLDIDVSTIPKGVYLLRYATRQKQFTTRLVKL